MIYVEEETYNKIYNEIMSSISKFLENNKYFNQSKENISQEVSNILNIIDLKEYENNKDKIINYVKKEIIERFGSVEENNNVRDTIADYLRAIGSYKLLSKEEEIDLFSKIKDDESVKKEIIERNLRLVVSIARRYSVYGYPILDLIQEGNLGLIKAVEKFDYTKGYRFSTYATWWIREFIVKSIYSKESAIRIPDYFNAQLSKLKKTERIYIAKYGIKPTNEELAKILNMSEEEVKDLKEHNFVYSSINEKINEDEDIELGDIISSEENVENNVIDNTLSEELKKYFDAANLTEEQRIAILYKFGFVDGKEHTNEYISKQINKTKERVRQTITKGLVKLKLCPYKDNMLIYYDENMEPENKKKLYL